MYTVCIMPYSIELEETFHYKDQIYEKGPCQVETEEELKWLEAANERVRNHRAKTAPKVQASEAETKEISITQAQVDLMIESAIAETEAKNAGEISELEEENEKLTVQVKELTEKVAELTEKLAAKPDENKAKTDETDQGSEGSSNEGSDSGSKKGGKLNV